MGICSQCYGLGNRFLSRKAEPIKAKRQPTCSFCKGSGLDQEGQRALAVIDALLAPYAEVRATIAALEYRRQVTSRTGVDLGPKEKPKPTT